MGDKSPKSTNKQAAQKGVKNAAKQKVVDDAKRDADAAKDAKKSPPKK